MSVTKNFFTGEGPEAEALIAEVKELRKAKNEAIANVQREYGSDALLARGAKVFGLVFIERQDRPYLKNEIRLESGFGYYPKLNCKQGKELAAKLKAPELQFDTSDYILDTLKLHRMYAGTHAASKTGMAMYLSVADYAGDKILVSIPGKKNEGALTGAPWPEVPTWFREVKESEWLAAQGK